MKTHYWVGLGFLTVVSIAALSQFGSTMEVVSNTPEKEIVVDEVLPEWAEDEEAVKAAQDVIRRKELEAELSQLEQTFASSTERYEAEKAEYQKKKVELEKQIGVY